MAAGPFSFFRGAAAIMAADLAATRTSGIDVQLCGDAHLSNFGVFASPERRLLFDVNDADEIVKAVKRRAPKGAVSAAKVGMRKARSRTSLQAVSKLTRRINGQLRFVDDPPLIVSLETLVKGTDPVRTVQDVKGFFAAYLDTLPDNRRHLLGRFDILDIAQKVVGVGSVGMRAFVVLLRGRDERDPIVLQFKEATASVLESHLRPSSYSSPAQRVVEGQLLMQAASDIFLGWSISEHDHRHYYWRQLRDMKGSADIAALSPAGLAAHADLCAWTLARAHARSGSPVAIASYLGAKPAFDDAIATFAVRYAQQNALDYEAHRRAIAEGRIGAQTVL